MNWLQKLIPLVHATLWFVWTLLLTLLVLNFIEARWIPTQSHWTPTALLALWSAHLTISLSVLLATQLSLLRRSILAVVIGAAFWVVSGWYWNEWSNSFLISPHRLTIEKAFFGQLVISNVFGVLFSSWLLTRKTKSAWFSTELKTSTRQLNFLLILVFGLLLAHFSSFLDLRDNRSMKILALATVCLLGGGTYHYVLRISQRGPASVWSGWRLISLFPASLFSMVLFNQSPEFKILPISLSLWFVYVYLSAPCVVSLAVLFTDPRERSFASKEHCSKSTKHRYRWVGGWISAALVVVLLLSFPRFGGLTPTLEHCRTEFDNFWRVTRMLNTLENHNIEFNVDWKRNGLKLRLPPNVPGDVLNVIHLADLSHAFLELTKVRPGLSIAALPRSRLTLTISDSELSIQQVQELLTHFEWVNLKNVEVLESPSQTPELADRLIPITKNLQLENCPAGTVAKLSNACGELSKVENYHLVYCWLDREDLNAIRKQVGKFKLYFDTETFAGFLTHAAENSPLAVPPATTPLEIRVTGDREWSPEEFPHLWTQIVDGVWNVSLPRVHPEYFFSAAFLSAGFENESFSRYNVTSVNLARENLARENFARENFVRENFALENSDVERRVKPFKFDRSVVIGESELKQLHWLFSSDLQSPTEAAPCDCLWLPNLAFLQHIDPKVIQQIRHLSFNRNWCRFTNYHQDSDRNDVLVSWDILANLTQLESLDLTTMSLFHGNPSIILPVGLKSLTMDGALSIPLTLSNLPNLEKLTVLQLPRATKLPATPLKTSVAITIIDREYVMSGHPDRNAASVALPNVKFLPIINLAEHRSELFETLRHQLRRQLRARIERAKQMHGHQPDH